MVTRFKSQMTSMVLSVCYTDNSLLGITELEKEIEKIETRHLFFKI
jgi:hypothetical protein